MGWIIFSLVAGYPSGDCLPGNFIAHLTPGAPDFEGALFAVLLAVIFGLLVYILPLVLLETEHAQPYPLWLHCFYWAANPWYYIVGIVCLAFAIRGFVLYEKLPAKPAVIEATGKKPLLK